jgi:tetratricopeptide (TPR) repeat protein
MQYKSGAARNLREIGQQLGVAHLLEGSVQRAGNKVRVNAQLIDARTDAHQWAENYDRPVDDVFAIQSEIAKAIADQLQAKLSPSEKKAIEQPPTTDVTAFDLYSRAKTILLSTTFSVTSEQSLQQAVELLSQAVTRDPSFFEAYCQLAYAHESLYAVVGIDHTPARLALAEAALQAATQLRPDAGETHLARAQYLYNGLRDYKSALAELEIARPSLVNDPRIFELTGYILRRRGQQEEGLRNLEKAVELDPRNYFIMQQIALSYQPLRRWEEEAAVLDRALTVVPENVETRIARAQVDLLWKADTRPLHQTIDSILAQGGAIATAADVWFLCAGGTRARCGGAGLGSGWRQFFFWRRQYFSEPQLWRRSAGTDDERRSEGTRRLHPSARRAGEDRTGATELWTAALCSRLDRRCSGKKTSRLTGRAPRD